jgi:two-component system sensor histidine kinase YesM
VLQAVLRRVRIQTILILAFFALNLALLLTLGTVSYRVAEQEILRNAGQARLALLDDASRRLSLRLRGIEDAALDLSLNPRFQEMLQPGDDVWLQARAMSEMPRFLVPYARHPEVSTVHVIVRDWQLAPVVTGGRGIVDERAVHSTDWYGAVQRFDSGWVGPHPNILTPNSPDREVVTYLRKAYSPQRTLLGIIAIDVRASELERGLGNVGPEPVLLVWAEGDRLNHAGPLTVDADVFQAMQALARTTEAGFQTVELREEPTLLLSSRPVQVGWRLFQLVPGEALAGGLVAIREALVWGGLACAVISLILAWALARALSRPILDLADAMRHVGEGRLDVRIPVRHQNEFGVLQNGFNRMVDRLERLVRDLDEEHRRKRQAELEALQAQINPHFLYNTLDTINWLAIGERQVKISEMVSLLGRFFRLGLSKGDTLVPLAQELEHLRTYLALQQIRFRGTFTAEERVDPEVMSLRVPKLILQPFVENALVHAFQHRGGTGTVRLGGSLVGEALVLSVADDGVGMTDGTIPDPRKVGMGYGIRNVDERIRLHFGSAYGVRIQSTDGEGTLVSITLPAIRQEEQKGVEHRVVSHAGR